MKDYAGIKLIKAEEMTADVASIFLKRPVDTSNADFHGHGYLVEYPDGYKSWSPKAQFEEAYFKTEGMDFDAICESAVAKLASTWDWKNKRG